MEHKDWTESFRFITPLMLLIISAFLAYLISDFTNFKVDIKGQLSCIDQKIFTHLTNDEMHSPRSIIVTKPEFMMYQQMRDRQVEDIKDSLERVEKILDKKK